MKVYKIKVLSNDSCIVGVKMLTEEQYLAIKGLFDDFENKSFTTLSFSFGGEDMSFSIEECRDGEFEMTEQGLKYVGESLGL